MAQKDKELLLVDLSARSPYGVKIHLETPEYGELIGTLDAVYPSDDRVIVDNLDKAIAPINVRCGGFNIEENECKPYLRPMSSMSEEEKKELKELHFYYTDGHIVNDEDKDFKSIIIDEVHCFCIIDWLNAHHFDYRGLIEKGLALEAKEGMYKLAM